MLRASEQGHIEATEFLKQCFQDGKGMLHVNHARTIMKEKTISPDKFFVGITEHNINEVIECLETTRNEKLSVKAMKDLFMK